MNLEEIGASLGDVFEHQAPEVEALMVRAGDILNGMRYQLSEVLGGSPNLRARIMLSNLHKAGDAICEVSGLLVGVRNENAALMQDWGLTPEATIIRDVDVTEDHFTIIDGVSSTTYNQFCRIGNTNTAEVVRRLGSLRSKFGLADDEPLMITEIPCSKGMETFSILAACEHQGLLDKIKVRAFDINPNVLAQTNRPYAVSMSVLAKHFSDWGLPPGCVLDNFDALSGDRIAPKQKLRDRVEFSRLDASTETPPPSHVVVVNNLMKHLKPGENEVGVTTMDNILASVLPGGIITINDANIPGVRAILDRRGFVPDASFGLNECGAHTVFRSMK